MKRLDAAGERASDTAEARLPAGQAGEGDGDGAGSGGGAVGGLGGGLRWGAGVDRAKERMYYTVR